jgi:hypothetical protein
MTKVRTVLAEARAWATKNKLFGNQAFLRYVIFHFTENLNQVTNDFVFKGGNLLWVYIDTPRATMDLDLVTIKTNSHSQVKALIEKSCTVNGSIKYKVLDFKKIEQKGKSGAAVTISYTTDQGASNQFDIDIVYAMGTDFHDIKSPLGTENNILSATVENIIADKLAACHQFASGNTRMKDYDDLWRISQSKVKISTTKIKKILRKRKIIAHLELSWIGPNMDRDWKSHVSKYRDLPTHLEHLFAEVNQWLQLLHQSRPKNK